MKKIIGFIKKYDSISVFIYMLVSLSCYIYAVNLYVSDELWLFSFLYKISNGYKLYRDLNVITTPLLYYIGRMIFFLFGDNYISFRIYGILIFSTFFTIIYILLKKLKVKKLNAITYILILQFIFSISSYIPIGTSYNFLCVIFVILAIILELNKNNKTKNNILKGIILFFIFMTKQNVAILYAISLIIINIIKLKQGNVKIKEIIKYLTVNFISCFIPLMIFFVYLIISNTVYEFISYCFLGMKEFGLRNVIITPYSIPWIIITVFGIVFSIIIIKLKNINNEVKETNLLLLPFEIIFALIAFPIIDGYHMLVGSIISFISIIYNFDYIFFTDFFKNIRCKAMKICVICISIYFLCINVFCYLSYKKSYEINHNIYPYIGIRIEDKLKDKIISICEFIKRNEEKGIETVILSPEANLYMNILNKNYKDLDLPNLGNLGKDGEDGLILNIKQLKVGTKILLTKSKICWQESDKAREFIINNYKKIDEIADYYIYEKDI